MSRGDRIGYERQPGASGGGGNQIEAGPGILSDINNGVQTLSLDPDYRGSGQWVPVVVFAFGGAIAQWSPSIGISSLVTYGAQGGSATEGSYDWPLARAKTASKMLFRIEYRSDSNVELRMRRRRADTDSWARFESNLVRYRNAASRDNNNLPVWSNWTTNNPVALVASPASWCWFEVECTCLPDDEISMHFAPENGTVNYTYFRIYVRI